MYVDLSRLSAIENPFQPTIFEVPSRELRVWLSLQLTRERGVLFNAKFVEPRANVAAQPDQAPCPDFRTVLGVVLDVLTSADESFFTGDLKLLGDALGTKQSAGRSLRIVRHAQQIASVFESYFVLGKHPAESAEDNVNRAWQLSLWQHCESIIRERAMFKLQEKLGEQDHFRNAQIVGLNELCDISANDTSQNTDNQGNIEWNTHSGTRAELRAIGNRITELLRSKEIENINMVAVVLPPAKFEIYAAQVSDVFNEEFGIPFVLHETLHNSGKGLAPAFAKFLELALSGCGKTELLEVLMLEPFAIARTQDEEKILTQWIRRLGVVGGLTASDLADTFVPADERQEKFHWMQAIDKLCELCLSVPEAESQVSVARGMFPLVQRFTHFIDVLSRFKENHSTTLKTLHSWAQVLRQLAMSLFEENLEFAGAGAHKEYSALLSSIRKIDIEHSTSEHFNAQMVTELLRRPLQRGRPQRTGGLFQRGVGVFALRPGSLLVPFTHVFVAGAEDGQMPRTQRVSAMHLFPFEALERDDTSKLRDQRALSELFSVKKRRVFISHTEKNVINGEKKRPSFELRNLVGKSVEIKAAPQIKVFVPESLTVRHAEEKVHRIASDKSHNQSSTQCTTEAKKHKITRHLSIKTLEDVILCPVIAIAKHRLAIAENPIYQKSEPYPDIEIAFETRASILKKAIHMWLAAPTEEGLPPESCLQIAIRKTAETTALPVKEQLCTEFVLMTGTLQNISKHCLDYRPAVQIALGSHSQQGEAIVLPSLSLGSVQLSGALSGALHFEQDKVTVIVVASSKLKNSGKTNQLPAEHSAKAMLTLCSLKCLSNDLKSLRENDILAQFQKAANWQIVILSTNNASEVPMLAIEFPAWHEEQARNWLESIATILDGGLPPLLPLKSASNPENTNELKLKDDFLKIRLGNYPYDNSILNGTILKNMPFETDVRSVMSSRFPWLDECRRKTT